MYYYCVILSTIVLFNSNEALSDGNVSVAITDDDNQNDFHRLRTTNDRFFVDKSAMIAEFLDVDSPSVICIVRPSGWGKTTNLDMLSRFLQLETDQNGEPIPLDRCENRALFVGNSNSSCPSWKRLKIATVEDAMRLQGTYPVVRLNLRHVDGQTYEQVGQQIRALIAALFDQFRYVIENLQPAERATFSAYRRGTADLDAVKTEALPFLSVLLCEYYNSKICILIDDYDRPMMNLFVRLLRRRRRNFKPDPETELYRRLSKRFETTVDRGIAESSDFREVFEFFQSFYESAFKRNLALDRGFLTGTFDVRFHDMFGGLNNVETYTLQHERFSRYYGFTTAEARKWTTINETVERTYGYNANGTVLYSPRSMKRLLSLLSSSSLSITASSLLSHDNSSDLRRTTDPCTVYLDNYLLTGDDVTFKRLLYLIEGKKISRFVTSEVRFNDITSWTFSYLLFKGYLNASAADFGEMQLSVANDEAREYLRSYIRLRSNVHRLKFERQQHGNLSQLWD